MQRRYKEDKISEECGVFGIYDRGMLPSKEHPNGIKSLNVSCAQLSYHGLYALQHRGQESCGIAVSDDGDIKFYKDTGLVGEVFNDNILNSLPGQVSVAHVRCSSTGSNKRENAQPLVTKYVKGALSIVHNGSLTNTKELTDELQEKGAIFQTTTDSEIIAYLIAQSRAHSPNVETAVSKVMSKLKGAYTLLVMSRKKIIAARDPLGFRPLCYGTIDNSAIVFASESCALDAVGAKFVRDVEPGEIVIVDKYGLRTIRDHCKGTMRRCIFEHIYFARSDSVIDGISVYLARMEAGKLLYKQSHVDADLVIGVPDSGIDAAIGYAQASGIPFCKGFVKNNYIGRTFIQPGQTNREVSVGIKLNAFGAAVKGKKVIMLDDSIVRGTTMANIVRMLKKAGAKEVHVRISSPPFLWPCFYGTDIPSTDELTASKNTKEQIRLNIGADSLAFLDVNLLDKMLNFGLTKKMVEGKTYCDACFTRDYPTQVNFEEKTNNIHFKGAEDDE